MSTGNPGPSSPPASGGKTPTTIATTAAPSRRLEAATSTSTALPTPGPSPGTALLPPTRSKRPRDRRGRFVPSSSLVRSTSPPTPSRPPTTAAVPTTVPAPSGQRRRWPRRRRRTQVELQMEQAVRYGYTDVPNVSVVTGEPLVVTKDRRRRRERSDPAVITARDIIKEIQKRRAAMSGGRC